MLKSSKLEDGELGGSPKSEHQSFVDITELGNDEKCGSSQKTSRSSTEAADETLSLHLGSSVDGGLPGESSGRHNTYDSAGAGSSRATEADVHEVVMMSRGMSHDKTSSTPVLST